MRKKKTRTKSNYKETIKKLPALISATMLEPDDKGFFINIKKLCKHLDVMPRSLNRYVIKLIDDGVLKVAHKGYQTGKHTMRYAFIEGQKPAGQDVCEALLKIYNNEENNVEECYTTTSRNYLRGNVLSSEEIQSDSNSRQRNDRRRIIGDESNNEEWQEDRLLAEIKRMTALVNTWSPLRLKNSCRWEEWTTGSKKIRKHENYRGRVTNALCFTKSGKREYKRQDSRPLRQTLLTQLGLGDYREVYDIKSQIPRVSHFLTSDVGFFEIDDYYQHFRQLSGNTLSREQVKAASMRCFFDNKSKKLFIHRLWLSTKMKTKTPALVNNFCTLFDAYQVVNPIGNEVFLWTSLLELYTLQYIYENYGVKCINVYDGFFAPKELNLNKIMSALEHSSYKIKSLYNK